MLKIQICSICNFMKNVDLEEINNLISDPIENYFECISSCEIKDGICISKCVEILKESGNR